jgi:hypothetical protein
MTDTEVAILAQTLTDVMRDVLRDALVPIDRRLAACEQMHAVGEACAQERDRLLGEQARHLDVLMRDVGGLRERVAVVETHEPMPGPPGPAGPPGVDGQDGRPGMEFKGTYTPGKTYARGDVTNWDGSGWHCNETTTARPGDGSKAWTLFVKRGRDGKDA